MINEEFNFSRTASLPSVTELLKRFHNLTPQALLSLAVLTLLQRTVTPQRVCGCGCGEAVTGKAKLAGVACRKRLERERKALRADGGKNLNLILQYEIPVTILTVTVPAELPADDLTQPIPATTFPRALAVP
jgi:hypothetical protein